MRVSNNTNIITESIYNYWIKISGLDKFVGKSIKRLPKFVLSVQKYLKKSGIDKITFRFVELLPELRVLVTANDIYYITKRYYVRNFTDDDYAKIETQRDGLYCSITLPNEQTKSFITPNINITNEYKLIGTVLNIVN